MKQDPTLHGIARERWRVAILLSSVVVAVYFGFVLLVAFDKPLMGMRIVPGLSVGILAGALVILAAWLTTWVYVRWASRRHDPALKRFNGEG